jgi:two-component system, cell cycle response regulator
MKASGQERHVLVCDDDEHTRNLLRDLCESAGFRVTMARDGAETFEAIQREKPDLLLLDLMMPQKDGFAVLQELRAAAGGADLPVIILTASGDLDGKIRGMELGADDFITKPFKLIELQVRMNSALLVREYRKKLQAAEEELAHLRAVDSLTGAGTYSQLKASVDAEIARSRRYGRPAAALLFGFDDYQGLRYQLGREECDEFIGGMGKEIRAALRGPDRLFRLDVDEFVVLLPETDLQGARNAAERLGAIVHKLRAQGREGSVEVRIRIGGAVFPHERVHSTEDLLREANRVYRALRDQGPKKLIFDL